MDVILTAGLRKYRNSVFSCSVVSYPPLLQLWMPGGLQNCETLGRFMLQFHGREFRRLSNEGSRRQRQTLLIGRPGRKEWRPARQLMNAPTSHWSCRGRWNARRVSKESNNE
uniref:Uncharacterized protein n=1 Tax=Bionectria ochroleuca TaxID=29856 RepID=A0A8H7NKH3_BIOOC